MLPNARQPSAAVPQTDALVLTPIQQHVGVESLPLTEGRYTIGTAADCEVVLAVQSVSPHHCVIEVHDGRAMLVQWDSKTWLNQRMILGKTELKSGDRLAVGPVEFLFRSAEQEEVVQQRPQGEADQEKTVLQELAQLQNILRSTDSRPAAPASTNRSIRQDDLRQQQREMFLQRQELQRKQTELENRERAVSQREQSLQAGKTDNDASDNSAAQRSRWQQMRDALITQRHELEQRRLTIDERERQLTSYEQRLNAQVAVIRKKRREVDAAERQLQERLRQSSSVVEPITPSTAVQEEPRELSVKLFSAESMVDESVSPSGNASDTTVVDQSPEPDNINASAVVSDEVKAVVGEESKPEAGDAAVATEEQSQFAVLLKQNEPVGIEASESPAEPPIERRPRRRPATLSRPVKPSETSEDEVPPSLKRRLALLLTTAVLLTVVLLGLVWIGYSQPNLYREMWWGVLAMDVLALLGVIETLDAIKRRR